MSTREDTERDHAPVFEAISAAHERRLVCLQALVATLPERAVVLALHVFLLEHACAPHLLGPYHFLDTLLALPLVPPPLCAALRGTLVIVRFSCERQVGLRG